MVRLQLIFLQLIFFSQGNANSVQKEPCINLMNFLDEQTTFIFQKTAVKVIKSFLWRAWKRRQLVLNSALSALWANVVFQAGSGSCCQSWTPEGWRMHIPLRDRHCRAPCAAPGQHNPTSWIAKLVLELCPNSSGTSPWSHGDLGCPGGCTFGISQADLTSLHPDPRAESWTPSPPNPAFLLWIISTTLSC